MKPRSLVLRVLAGLALAAFYLWSVPLASDAQLLGNDAFAYAGGLASGEFARVLDPHHLLHHILAFGVLKLQVAASGGAEPGVAEGLLALRLVSAFGGAACAVAVAHYSARLAGRAAGLWLGAGFAFSAGPWLYSAVGETYLPAAAVSAWLFGELLTAANAKRAMPLFRLAAILTLACLLRQDSVLLVPGVLILAGPRLGSRAVGIAGLASLAFYGLAHRFSGSEAGLLDWLQGLANTNLWGEGFSLSRAAVALITQQHALHYGVRFGSGWTFLSLLTGALLAIAALAAGGPWRRPGLTQGLLALGVTVAVRLLFFTWWQPSNTEYHTPTLVPVFLSLALVVGRSERAVHARWSTRLGAAAAASLLLGNGACLMQPLQTQHGQTRARTALEQAGPQGLVLALDPYSRFALELIAPPGARIADGALPQARDNQAALIESMTATLAQGEPVALLRDVSLFPRLAFPLYPIDNELLAGLGQLEVQTERFEQAGEPWLLVLRPKP